MNMNPLDLIKAIKNPEEFVMNYLSTNSSPMGKNLLELAKNGDEASLENIARNLFKERGQDFDEIMKLLKK